MTNRCMPGLGQGHGKKRHLHAHSPVNFKELKCYNQISLENTVKDVDGASKLAQEIIGLLNSENERSRVEQVHDFSQANLLDLLS